MGVVGKPSLYFFVLKQWENLFGKKTLGLNMSNCVLSHELSSHSLAPLKSPSLNHVLILSPTTKWYDRSNNFFLCFILKIYLKAKDLLLLDVLYVMPQVRKFKKLTIKILF